MLNTYLGHFIFTCELLPLHTFIQRQDEPDVVCIGLENMLENYIKMCTFNMNYKKNVKAIFKIKIR